MKIVLKCKINLIEGNTVYTKEYQTVSSVSR